MKIYLNSNDLGLYQKKEPTTTTHIIAAQTRLLNV